MGRAGSFCHRQQPNETPLIRTFHGEITHYQGFSAQLFSQKPYFIPLWHSLFSNTILIFFTAYQQVKRKDLQAVVDGYCKFWV
jgi:hypothetical protein